MPRLAHKTSPIITGLRFGGLWVAIMFVLGIISTLFLGRYYISFFNFRSIVTLLLGIVVMLALAFLAGFAAARQSHRVRDGLLAGLFVGIVSGVAYLIIMYVAGIIVGFILFHGFYVLRPNLFAILYIPLLSCWGQRVVGVHECTEIGEAGCEVGKGVEP